VPGIGDDVGERFEPRRIGELVQGHHGVGGGGEKVANKIGANEPCAARDENLHSTEGLAKTAENRVPIRMSHI
jgi:hypothetical protein